MLAHQRGRGRPLDRADRSARRSARSSPAPGQAASASHELARLVAAGRHGVRRARGAVTIALRLRGHRAPGSSSGRPSRRTAGRCRWSPRPMSPARPAASARETAARLPGREGRREDRRRREQAADRARATRARSCSPTRAGSRPRSTPAPRARERPTRSGSRPRTTGRRSRPALRRPPFASLVVAVARRHRATRSPATRSRTRPRSSLGRRRGSWRSSSRSSASGSASSASCGTSAATSSTSRPRASRRGACAASSGPARSILVGLGLAGGVGLGALLSRARRLARPRLGDERRPGAPAPLRPRLAPRRPRRRGARPRRARGRRGDRRSRPSAAPGPSARPGASSERGDRRPRRLPHPPLGRRDGRRPAGADACGSRRARSSSCSGRAARGRRRSCAWSRGWTGSPRERRACSAPRSAASGRGAAARFRARGISACSTSTTRGRSLPTSRACTRVALSLELAGAARARGPRGRGRRCSSRVGLGDRLDDRARSGCRAESSSGSRSARRSRTGRRLLLADEPAGELDAEKRRDRLRPRSPSSSASIGATALVVSHDEAGRRHRRPPRLRPRRPGGRGGAAAAGRRRSSSPSRAGSACPTRCSTRSALRGGSTPRSATATVVLSGGRRRPGAPSCRPRVLDAARAAGGRRWPSCGTSARSFPGAAHPVLDGVSRTFRGRHVHRRRRPVGKRQDDAAAPARRARPPHARET